MDNKHEEKQTESVASRHKPNYGQQFSSRCDRVVLFMKTPNFLLGLGLLALIMSLVALCSVREMRRDVYKDAYYRTMQQNLIDDPYMQSQRNLLLQWMHGQRMR